MNVLKYVYKDPYDFLFMNFDEPWDQVYHRNFAKLILDNSYLVHCGHGPDTSIGHERETNPFLNA